MDKKNINNFITECITNINQNGDHFTEQYKYIIPNINIIKFENLKEEFNFLMKKYNLPLEIKNEFYNKRFHREIFKIKDLNPDNINLIKMIYKDDFKMFKYFNFL